MLHLGLFSDYFSQIALPSSSAAVFRCKCPNGQLVDAAISFLQNQKNHSQRYFIKMIKI